ncbi:mRNA interferase [Spirochaetia bacterium]|nr:mRNA interferase [Spirochaetia bacterium]
MINRGEIWLIELDPTVGAEMRKTRPALVISDNAIGKLPLRVVVPLTGWKEHFQSWPWLVRIESGAENGLGKASAADCFQIRSVSVDRMVNRLGVVEPEIVAQVQAAIELVIGAY